ncbi:MAG: electron transfer flavoprotein subunit alpha [Candidatus Cloacimonetes bacterium]|nr:electron transfer flavoprotein subunit alpha [Candidatus Cloacimonadota bacterium]
MMIEVISQKCTGCTKCLKVCAYQAIEIKDKTAEINADKCTLCGACVSACPFEAIIVRRFTDKSVNKDDYKGVWVFAEQRNNVISPVVFELLGKGRELADKRETDLTAVLLGENISCLTEELIKCGADNVIVVDKKELKDFTDLPYAETMISLIEKYKPEIILAGATHVGRSFIPRVATKVHTGLTADCTSLDIDSETNNLMQTRPAFGGNIMATILTPNHRPQIATVRHKVMVPFPKDDNRKGKIINEDVDLSNKTNLCEFIRTIKDDSNRVNLADANFVVSGGRGMKEAKNFEMLHKLAELLDGAVGASRAAVDSEWIGYPHQVGQTGKTIKPKIYLSFGISGAIQHMAGMQSSDYIIAINKDTDAPIFNVADLGVVSDLFDVLPKLIKRLEE